MQAQNRSERSSSIITFIALYVLLLAIPLYLGFMLGKENKHDVSTGGGEVNPEEQKLLTVSLVTIQKYIGIMEKRDGAQANGGKETTPLWQQWVADAKREKDEFDTAIKQLQSLDFTGTRKDIRNSAIIYLSRLSIERAARISLEESLHGVRSEATQLQQLKSENEALKNTNQEKQNIIDTKNQMIADLQKSNYSRQESSQTNEAVTNLQWELLYCDANSQKTQADLLSSCNLIAKRKQLYTVAKTNFKKISNGPVPSIILKRSAVEKIREIDQLLAKL